MVIKMKKYNCTICGHFFELNDDNDTCCPICGTNDKEYLLEALEIEDKSKDELREVLGTYLKRKCHSAAYIKLCSKKLEELGYYELSKELDMVAQKKLEYEAILLELFGVKNDIRLNLNNVVTRAIEDVYLANKITELEKKNHNDDIFNLLKNLKHEEEKNIFVLNCIAKKCLHEFQDNI